MVKLNRIIDINKGNEQGFTPLILASKGNQIGLVKLLLKHDFIDVSKGYYKCIELTLRDVRGNVIDLNKAHWSMSIVFSTIKEKE